MGEAQAQKTVLAAMLAVVGTVGYTNLKRRGQLVPSGQLPTVLALLILGIVLSAGASVAPEITGPFAILIALAIVLSRVGGGSGTPPPRGSGGGGNRFPI